MRGLRSLLVAAIAGFCVVSIAAAEEESGRYEQPTLFSHCLNPPAPEFTPDERIAACTEIINSKQFGTEDRFKAFRARADNYEQKGDFVSAIADYTRALELHPNDPNTYFYRCEAYASVGDTQRALADCDKGVALAPEDPQSYANRAEVLDQLGQYERAAADLTHALSIARPEEEASLYRARGLVHRHKGDYPRALADFNASLARVARNWAVLNDRGLVYFDMGDVDRALSDFTAAIAIKPTFARAYSNRALCFAERDDIPRAIAELDRAIALSPEEAAFFHNRALYHLFIEEYDQAIADAEQALRLRPKLGQASDIIEQARRAKAAIAARKLAPPNDARIALVIGNSRYKYGPPLPNPVHDAEDVARELRALGYAIYGYPKTDFSRAELLAQIGAFFEAAKGAQAAVVWYSGHGQEFVDIDGDFGRNWLIPIDAHLEKSSDIATQGVTLGELLTSVMPAKGLRMVVVDACRDNGFRPAIPLAGFSREGRLGMLVVYSTKPGSFATDGRGRNSPFAEAFVNEVHTGARGDLRALLDRVARATNAATDRQQQPEVVDRYGAEALPMLVR